MNLLAAVLGYFSLPAWQPEDATSLVVQSPEPELFQNFQIDVPLPDFGDPFFEAPLLDHVFAASWGKPCSVEYTPPTNEFDHVTFTLKITTPQSIQFDRLAHIFVNGIELWRPSTSEPRGRASLSSYTKDMSIFRSLLSEPGTISVELDNLVTERLNGTFHVELSAAYYNTLKPKTSTWFEQDGEPASTVSGVLPCSVATKRVNRQLSAVPRNTTRAVLQVFATGNGNDEFWYAESSRALEDYNLGPLRHVRVEIGGQLAGVASPFYNVYTGGFQPALWSPFVAPATYDVPAFYLDISPFLPQLWDADLDVTFVVQNGANLDVRHEWILSAALLTWETAQWSGLPGGAPQVVEQNQTHEVLLPGIEVVKFSQTLTVSTELEFETAADETVKRLCEVEHERDVSASLVGETVVNHASHGASRTFWGDRNYSLGYDHEISLVFENSSVVVAIGRDTYEHTFSSSEDLFARSQSTYYNGSWGFNNSKNGSDVFVKLRDPQEIGPETYHRHAKSRNGTVVSFDVPSSRAWSYKSDVVEASREHVAGFPFVAPDPKELRERKEIRRKWMHHCL